jgi:hypothetical protein
MSTEAHLVSTIKAHIERGDKAKEKSEQHYIAAGLHLQELKDRFTETWAEWEALLERTGIGKTRASELMRIASGRKTAEEVRADTARRTRKSRRSSPPRSGEAEAPKAAERPVTSGADDIGPTGDSEIARKLARLEELEHENARLRRENIALRSEIEELKAQLAGTSDDGLDLPESLRRASPH